MSCTWPRDCSSTAGVRVQVSNDEFLDSDFPLHPLSDRRRRDLAEIRQVRREEGFLFGIRVWFGVTASSHWVHASTSGDVSPAQTKRIRRCGISPCDPAIGDGCTGERSLVCNMLAARVLADLGGSMADRRAEVTLDYRVSLGYRPPRFGVVGFRGPSPCARPPQIDWRRRNILVCQPLRQGAA